MRELVCVGQFLDKTWSRPEFRTCFGTVQDCCSWEPHQEVSHAVVFYGWSSKVSTHGGGVCQVQAVRVPHKLEPGHDTWLQRCKQYVCGQLCVRECLASATFVDAHMDTKSKSGLAPSVTDPHLGQGARISQSRGSDCAPLDQYAHRRKLISTSTVLRELATMRAAPLPWSVHAAPRQHCPTRRAQDPMTARERRCHLGLQRHS